MKMAKITGDKHEYISVNTAAARYGFSQYQIHALAINGKIKYKIAERQVMILESSLSKFEKKYPNIVAVMRQRTTGDLAFVNFLGYTQNEFGEIVKA